MIGYKWNLQIVIRAYQMQPQQCHIYSLWLFSWLEFFLSTLLTIILCLRDIKPWTTTNNIKHTVQLNVNLTTYKSHSNKKKKNRNTNKNINLSTKEFVLIEVYITMNYEYLGGFNKMYLLIIPKFLSIMWSGQIL